MGSTLESLSERVGQAVSFFWKTRKGQADRQLAAGTSDQGARAMVTGGKQMDGVIQLMVDLVQEGSEMRAGLLLLEKLERLRKRHPCMQQGLDLSVEEQEILAAYLFWARKEWESESRPCAR